MDNKNTKQETPQPLPKKPDERGNVVIEDHIKIVDLTTNEVLLSKR